MSRTIRFDPDERKPAEYRRIGQAKRLRWLPQPAETDMRHALQLWPSG